MPTVTSATKKKKKTTLETFKEMNPLSFGEEIGNAVSHGVAAFLMLIALPYAAVHSYAHSGVLMSVSVSVFVISLFLMFISSTVYHSMQQASPHKYVMRIIDHSMIYVAITGTYTPVSLVLVGGWLGWSIMILLWGTTLWGILYKAIATQVNAKLSLIIYLIMGWVGVIYLPIIINKGAWLFFIFILLGGLAYTIGAWFYAQKNRPYFHMIWHIFIFIASIFHFIGILYFM
ncbi:hemolysin III family protein [Staphylococcus coagulans]|uniref:Hemolysin III family protein n=1 Tax=Staphylococcus coagulans TaxID=74706 RepID=A0A9X1E9U3_9STAP|nr:MULTISPECIES: hemolysin III family protein [Staphylococcus]NHA37282.1 hemolysin III [Staphylococcus schleiferi]MBA8761998.1 hemolysin III family protein [Staphylococcus coagulans]MBA8772954.1 hemolysin III family protein [Staphylococcus coagulans]MBA8776791.1 hemolysin III family protein [Staphylococcus coagulans]MBT2830302.1 hemolysin III family protein [Staphylococcus coagulans]